MSDVESMIVCVCNALNDRCVRAAIEAGAESASDVHAHHDRSINCGSCVEHIDAMIGASRAALRHAAE